MSRIWRAYLMSEMSDNFGPIPINGFQGVNPTFSDVKTVYYFLLDELKDASAKLETGVTAKPADANGDPAYAYNYAKWKKYANSMRMRLAMRLSEVDAAKGLYANLYNDYEHRSSLEARLVKAADVLDLLVQVLALERSGARGLDEFWKVAEKPGFNLEGVAEQIVQELLDSILKARSELRNK